MNFTIEKHVHALGHFYLGLFLPPWNPQSHSLHRKFDGVRITYWRTGDDIETFINLFFYSTIGFIGIRLHSRTNSFRFCRLAFFLARLNMKTNDIHCDHGSCTVDRKWMIDVFVLLLKTWNSKRIEIGFCGHQSTDIIKSIYRSLHVQVEYFVHIEVYARKNNVKVKLYVIWIEILFKIYNACIEL